MLNSVMNTDDGWYIVAGQMIVLSNLEFTLDNIRPRGQLGNNLLTFFLSDVTKLVFNRLLRTGCKC